MGGEGVREGWRGWRGRWGGESGRRRKLRAKVESGWEGVEVELQGGRWRVEGGGGGEGVREGWRGWSRGAEAEAEGEGRGGGCARWRDGGCGGDGGWRVEGGRWRVEGRLWGGGLCWPN